MHITILVELIGIKCFRDGIRENLTKDNVILLKCYFTWVSCSLFYKYELHLAINYVVEILFSNVTFEATNRFGALASGLTAYGADV